MTTLEERLRTELPQLADALLRLDGDPTTDTAASPVVIDVSSTADRGVLSRRRILVGTAAAVAAGAAIGVGIGTDWPGRSDSGTSVVAAGLQVPVGFGTWRPMADGLIEPRPYATTTWTGSRVVFWAGSSLSRGFAYTDGALYDPVTDTWEPMTVPGWGHPGLTSAFFDGELYAVAKGGGTRFDPVAGEWRDLPPVEDMYLAATVATEDGIWGVGPADLNAVEQPDLALAQYHPDADRWTYGPAWEGTDEQASIVAGLAGLESTALWTGTEIAVCGRTGRCVAFDPANETWRSLPPVTEAEPPAIAVGTDLGLAMLVQTNSAGTQAAVALLTDSGWNQRATQIPVEDFATVTVASAGEWLVIFGSGQRPIVMNLATGTWHVETDSPLGGVQAPNAAWTGDQLVVWGGVPDDLPAADGAIWTPPTN